MTDTLFIAGSGSTRFGRQPQATTKDLVAESVTLALSDAGAVISDLGAAFYGNVGQGALEGQHAIRGQIALRSAGIEMIPIVNVESACASGAAAFWLACTHLLAGKSDIVLVVGAEKMNVGDKDRIQSVFDGGWDVSTVEDNVRRMAEIGGDFAPEPTSRTIFMDCYAAQMRWHMNAFGTTQRQLASIAAKNHGNGVQNPLACDARSFSVEEVIANREIVWPLTRPMCSPISDGAAALVICNERGLRHLGASAPVRILASEFVSGSEREFGDLERHLSARCAQQAYESAGVGPEDLDVVEVHDATAFGELLQTECLGLCPIGGGGPFAESGATKIGGRVAVNSSGGLVSKGHPVGATGVGQVHELVTQLRGRAGARQVTDARIGLAENGGGLLGVEEAAASVIILGRD